MTDASRDELFALVPLAVPLVGVVAHPASGDDVVALGQTLRPLLGGTAIRDEVVEGRLQLREGVVGFLAVVLDPDLQVEACVATLGLTELRVRSNETGDGLMGANGHDGVLLNSGDPLHVIAVRGRCAPAPRDVRVRGGAGGLRVRRGRYEAAQQPVGMARPAWQRS